MVLQVDDLSSEAKVQQEQPNNRVATFMSDRSWLGSLFHNAHRSESFRRHRPESHSQSTVTPSVATIPLGDGRRYVAIFLFRFRLCKGRMFRDVWPGNRRASRVLRPSYKSEALTRTDFIAPRTAFIALMLNYEGTLTRIVPLVENEPSLNLT